MNRPAVLLLTGCGLAWTIGWLMLAWTRYRNEVRCLLFYGPWLPCGDTNWSLPALLSLIPSVLLLGWAARWAWRRLIRSISSR
jgi:hypothetical protein